MNVNANELGDQVLALPAAERIRLAQRLWDSLNGEERGALIGDESETLQAAKHRDAELSKGSVTARFHEEVMESARKSIECE